MADHGHGHGGGGHHKADDHGHGGGDHGHKADDHGGHKGGGGGGGGLTKILWFVFKAALILVPLILISRAVQAISDWSLTQALTDLADKGVKWSYDHDHVISDTLNSTSVDHTPAKKPAPAQTASAPRWTGKPGPALVRH